MKRLTLLLVMVLGASCAARAQFDVQARSIFALADTPLNIYGDDSTSGDIILNPGAVSGAGKVSVVGGVADDYALLVTAAASPTVEIFRINDSAAAEVFSVEADGQVTMTNHLSLDFNNAVIFADDTGGTARRIVYFDNTNDLWLGPDQSLGSIPSGGDVILRAAAASGSEVLVELDGNSGVANDGELIPGSGDNVALGDLTAPFFTAHINDSVSIYNSDGAGGAIPTLQLWSDGGFATNLRSAATVNHFLLLPASLPGSTECLELTSAGQIQASGGSCAGGGGSSGTNDEIQITDNAGGFTTVANFRYDSGNVALNLPLHIRPNTDSGFDIGTASLRHDEIFADNMITEELFFRRQGAGAHDFLFQAVSSSVLQIQNSASVNLIVIDEAVDQHIEFNRDIMPTSTGAFIDIGETGKYFDEIWAATHRAVTGFIPDTAGGAYAGTSSNYFSSVWGDSINGVSEVSVYNNGSVVAREEDGDVVLAELLAENAVTTNEVGKLYLSNELTADTLELGGTGYLLTEDGSGNDYAFLTGGSLTLGTASTYQGVITLNDSGSSSTWSIRGENESGGSGGETTGDLFPAVNNTDDLGTTSRRWTTAYAVRHNASVAFVGPSGTDGTSTTLTCGAGQAVKNITISGGVVTSASCGTP